MPETTTPAPPPAAIPQQPPPASIAAALQAAAVQRCALRLAGAAALQLRLPDGAAVARAAAAEVLSEFPAAAGCPDLRQAAWQAAAAYAAAYCQQTRQQQIVAQEETLPDPAAERIYAGGGRAGGPAAAGGRQSQLWPPGYPAGRKRPQPETNQPRPGAEPAMQFQRVPETDPAIDLSPQAELNLQAMFPEEAWANPGVQQYIRELLQGFIGRLEAGDYGVHAPPAVAAASAENRAADYGDLAGWYRVNEDCGASEYPYSYAVIRQLPAKGYMVLLDAEHRKVLDGLPA